MEIVRTILAVVAGSVMAVVVQSVRHKRSVFTYLVRHDRVGMSTDDPTYGSVRVTWNDNPVTDLFLSTLEIKNDSMRDYEAVSVIIYSTDTTLLTEAAVFADSVKPIGYSEEFKESIAVPVGGTPTPDQYQIYRARREFVVSAWNRGQSARFTILNVVHAPGGPTIWAEVPHKGIVCKFRSPRVEIFGVQRWKAVVAGTIVGLAGVGVVADMLPSRLTVGLASFVIGWLVLLPGVGVVRTLEKLRGWLAS